MSQGQSRRSVPTTRIRGAFQGVAALLLAPLILYGVWTLQVVVAPPLYGLLDALPVPGAVAGRDVMDKSAELHADFTSSVIALVTSGDAEAASGAASPGTDAAPTAATMTWDEWVVFSDNGIVERRMRFEQFSPPPTPATVVHDFVAYLDREIDRTEAIHPEECWAAGHAAYIDVMRNDRLMLQYILDGEMAEAEALLAKTGNLNHALTQTQRTAALECDPGREYALAETATASLARPRPVPTPRPTLSATDRMALIRKWPMVPSDLRKRLEQASTCADTDDVKADVDAKRAKAERKLKNLQRQEKRYRKKLQAERKNPTQLDGVNVRKMYKSFIETNEMTQGLQRVELGRLDQADEYAAFQHSELGCPAI